MKVVHLVCNPTSGKGNTLSVLKKIEEWAKTQSELNLIIHKTENIGHATIITKDLTSGTDPVYILVLGGDGTVNEVLNGIDNFDQTFLGILPFGSGNDFVKALNMNNPDPIDLMNKYINQTKTRKVDYLLINDKYRSINEIGLGLSAEVLAMRDKMKHFSPVMQYKIATVIKSLFWKSFNYKMTIDDKAPTEIKSMWFTINNGNCIGGGMVTDLSAKIDDGLINIMFINKFARIKTLPCLIKAKKGKASQLKQATKFTCKKIILEGEHMNLEYDGVTLEDLSKVEVVIVPSKLNLLVTE